MYSGPIVDAFFHPGWAATTAETFGDRDTWVNDPMRNRVMRTFRQAGDQPTTPETGMEGTLREMDGAGVARAIFQASLYYPCERPTLEARLVEHFDIIRAHPDRFDHGGTVLPPVQGPASYWDLLQNPRFLKEAVEKYNIMGMHLLPAPWGTPP